MSKTFSERVEESILYSKGKDKASSAKMVRQKQKATKEERPAIVKQKPEKKADKRKYIFALLITLLSVIAIVFLIPRGENKPGPESSDIVQSSESSSSSESVAQSSSESSEEPPSGYGGSIEHPLELEDWEKTAWYLLEDKALVSSKFEGEDFHQTLLSVPSADTFSRGENKFLENGIPNQGYTNLSSEDWIYYTSLYIERIINPIFGNWEMYQYGSLSNPNSRSFTNLFLDMLSSELANSVDLSNPSSWLPVYADWNSDDYEGSNFSTLYRWIGEVTSSSSKISMNSGVRRLELTLQVEYTSVIDEEVAKIPKTLVLTLEENQTGTGNPIVITKIEGSN